MLGLWTVPVIVVATVLALAVSFALAQLRRQGFAAALPQV